MGMEPITPSFLTLDAQRRVSLGRLVPKSVTGFLAAVGEDGSITLTPATPVPDLELSPSVLAEVRAGEADVLAGRGLRYRPGVDDLVALLEDAE